MSSIKDKENYSFEELEHNLYARRIKPVDDLLADDGSGGILLKTSAKGEFVFSGLSQGMRITTLNVTDTATLIPAIPLTDRNTLSFINLGDNTLYLGNIDVTADRSLGTTAGWEIASGEGINFDIKNNVNLYAICESGKSTLIKIMEIA